MRDAINEIVAVMDSFPAIFKFTIVDANHFYIHYHLDHNEEEFQEQFTDTVACLEWCESNLKNHS